MIFYFSMNISYHDFQQYYRGQADKVEVRDTKGRVLWIHGRHFRRFLTSLGIQGQFKLVLTEQGELVSLCKLKSS
ncbi:DUF2835 domain-containing protein [Shewanella sp. UCD-KL12]|uniref:DUF2835 domain-containing protein n=1 Tax=Shewanella sp. UCD-KL12 TaxID=1917163 RepID=UPI00097095F2|nr:DUF2835 domain-containing protein [Shewanella sp. UCD-KL12]